MLKEQKFHLDEKQAKFLDRYREYGFKDKSELVITALQGLQSELEAKELQESAELYAEIYREDKELQAFAESAIDIEGKNMINPKIEKQIIRLLTKMNEQQQQELLNFAGFLTTTKPVGVPGKDLLKFAGSIPKEELDDMAKTIEEEFGYKSELEARELQESAELYAEIYREDRDLQALTESALEEWPQD